MIEIKTPQGVNEMNEKLCDEHPHHVRVRFGGKVIGRCAVFGKYLLNGLECQLAKIVRRLRKGICLHGKSL